MEKRKRKWITTVAACSLLLAVMIGAVVGYISYRMRPVEFNGAHAGSYVRGSEEYEDFLHFVKKHAQTKKVYETDAEDGEKAGTILYTLDTAEVKKWGKPGNRVTFDATKVEILDDIKALGREITLLSKKDTNEVFVRTAGVIETTFRRVEDYDVGDDVRVRISSDQISGRVYSVFVAPIAQEDTQTQEVAERIYRLLSFNPDVSEETINEEAQKIYDNLLLVKEQGDAKKITYFNQKSVLFVTQVKDVPGYGYLISPYAIFGGKPIDW